MPVSDPEDHQHGSRFRDRRDHAQSTEDDTNSHPDSPRRASVDKTVLRREQDALPRTMTKPTIEMKRKFRRSSCRLLIRLISSTSWPTAWQAPSFLANGIVGSCVGARFHHWTYNHTTDVGRMEELAFAWIPCRFRKVGLTTSSDLAVRLHAQHFRPILSLFQNLARYQHQDCSANEMLRSPGG